MHHAIPTHGDLRPVPALSEAGYEGSPRIESCRQLAPLTFVWWACTSTGRQSKYTHAWSTPRLRRLQPAAEPYPLYVPTAHYGQHAREIYRSLRARGAVLCPPLPRGYVWHGPALYEDVAAPLSEGPWHDGIFRFEEPPIPPDGARLTLSDAKRLATQILRGTATARIHAGRLPGAPTRTFP